MPEPVFVLAALMAGGLFTSAVLLAAPGGRGRAAALLAARTASPVAAVAQGHAWRRAWQSAGVHGWLALRIARAGWHESPERLAALTLILAAGLAALAVSLAVVSGAAAASAFTVAGAASGLGAVAFSLKSAITRRRRRLSRELAPLLELFILELGGGGSALSALGSVTTQLEGELAAEVRRLLIASQTAGSTSFESRLREYSDRLEIPAIGSLATILAASREYGTPVAQGVKALASDLRRVQRRELIAHSRRALNHVLFPAAIGVLLPFLAILLFPAVTSLERNLR